MTVARHKIKWLLAAILAGVVITWFGSRGATGESQLSDVNLPGFLVSLALSWFVSDALLGSVFWVANSLTWGLVFFAIGSVVVYLARLRRLGLLIFTAHILVTLLIGYIVLPQFQTMQEPPPLPPPYAPLVIAVTRVFYFPIVLLAKKLLVTGWARPGISYVVVNSVVVSILVKGVYALVSRNALGGEK